MKGARRWPRTTDFRHSPALWGNRKVPAGIALGDVNQLLPHDFEESRYQAVAGLPAGELQGVAQKRDARPGLLSQIVDRPARHEHLRFEGHPFGMAVARAMEEVADVRVRLSWSRTEAAASMSVWLARALRNRIASNRFDFPDPLGPTTQVNGPRLTSTSRGLDVYQRFLKPVTFSRVNMHRCEPPPIS